MIFKIRIAQRVVYIESMYDFVYELCKDYTVNADILEDFSVIIRQEDIDNERMLSLNNGISRTNPDSFFEVSAVHRKIANCILRYDTLLMHGSVIAIDDFAFMFSASSGVGKTTYTNLLIKEYESAFIVNGDKPFVGINQDDTVWTCGAPWSGKERYNENREIVLRSICFIMRGEKNDVKKVDFHKVFPLLLQQTYRFNNPKDDQYKIDLLFRLRKNIKFYQMTLKYYDKADEMGGDELRLFRDFIYNEGN